MIKIIYLILLALIPLSCFSSEKNTKQEKISKINFDDVLEYEKMSI